MKVNFHTSLLSAVTPPELIPNSSKRRGELGGQASRMLLLLLGALWVLVRLCPLHTSNQKDALLISQNKTTSLFSRNIYLSDFWNVRRV